MTFPFGVRMDNIPAPKEIKVLETVEDIKGRRSEVLGRYSEFKGDAAAKRTKLEDSRRFQYFKRDADELESWIIEKLQTASDESYKDPTNLQAKIQKHQAFEAEVQAHANAISELDTSGERMIGENHFASKVIRVRISKIFSFFPQNFNVLLFLGTTRRDSPTLGAVVYKAS